jgi:lysozyme family protein
MDSKTTFEQYIGHIAVHETGHSVDPNGRGTIVGTVTAEATANKYQMEAIKETQIQNNKIKAEVRLLDIK